MIAAINRLYRTIFCRGGHGVHSPFVFDLITKVVEEKESYYCYERLSAVRKQLQQNCDKIICRDREYAIKDFLNKFCFSEREYQLLFRLANRFQPQTIYVLGSDLGLAPLYLTSWSERASCIVFEREPSMAVVARKVVDKYSYASIYIQAFDNPEIADDSIIDLIVWGNTYTDFAGDTKHDDNAFSIEAFKGFLPYLNDNSIMIVSGINSSRKNQETWKMICSIPEVTVTLDLYSLGIVFFNPKLHRKMYKSVVL